MTEDRIRTAGQKSSVRLRVLRSNSADEIHTTVERLEPTVTQTRLDLRPADTGIQDLRPAHNAVGARSKRHDDGIWGSFADFCTHATYNPANVRRAPLIHRKGLDQIPFSEPLLSPECARFLDLSHRVARAHCPRDHDPRVNPAQPERSALV